MLANAQFELQTPVAWWDDLVHGVSILPVHYRSCLRASPAQQPHRCTDYCWSITFLRKKTNTALFYFKKRHKKPKNSV